MISIILADDHRIVRKGLQALLSYEADFKVIGEAANGQEALEAVERLRPDVLILDLMMPVMNGLECASRLKSSQFCPRILILSMHSNEQYVIEALRCGARAYILKENISQQLILAIREVCAGRFYLGVPGPEDLRQFVPDKAPATGKSPGQLIQTAMQNGLATAREAPSEKPVQT